MALTNSLLLKVSRIMGLDQFSILQVIILAFLEEDTKVDRAKTKKLM